MDRSGRAAGWRCAVTAPLADPRSLIRIEVEDGVAVLTVLRPLLSTATVEAATGAFATREVMGRPVVVLSAHPEIFLAGADLAEIAALDRFTSDPYARRGRQLMETVRAHAGPVVAGIHGICAGGGVDLVLSCDAIVASDDARLQHPGARRGLITGWSGTHAVPVRLGRRRSAPLLTGETVALSDVPGASTIGSTQVRSAAIAEARRLSRLHSSRLDLWRSFRCGRFVDSFRARMVHNLKDWNQSV